MLNLVFYVIISQVRSMGATLSKEHGNQFVAICGWWWHCWCFRYCTVIIICHKFSIIGRIMIGVDMVVIEPCRAMLMLSSSTTNITCKSCNKRDAFCFDWYWAISYKHNGGNINDKKGRCRGERCNVLRITGMMCVIASENRGQGATSRLGTRTKPCDIHMDVGNQLMAYYNNTW